VTPPPSRQWQPQSLPSVRSPLSEKTPLLMAALDRGIRPPDSRNRVGRVGVRPRHARSWHRSRTRTGRTNSTGPHQPATACPGSSATGANLCSMGQRKRRARAKKRHHRSGTPGPSRSLEAGPFWIEQHGADIVHGVDAEHPDFAEFQRALREAVARTPTVVQELRATIADGAAGHHAFDVISAVWLSTGVVRPGTLQSYHPEVPTSTAAYVAHVLLERESPEPVREPTPEDAQRGVDVESMAAAVQQILQRLPRILPSGKAPSRGRPIRSSIYEPSCTRITSPSAHLPSSGKSARPSGACSGRSTRS
jgi:hypothetical protein